MKTTQEYIQILGEFKRAYAQKFGLLKIGIFGSVSRSEHTEKSDLDVFVEMPNPDYFLFAEMKDELERQCGCPIDLVRLRPSLRPLLRQRIEEDGILI